MGHGRYILEGRKPVLEPDLFKWAVWFETAERRVAKTEVGRRTVSTVFLGLDHGYHEQHPILFETMVFDTATMFSGSPLNMLLAAHEADRDPWQNYGERCGGSFEQAEEMHRRVVALLQQHPEAPPES